MSRRSKKLEVCEEFEQLEDLIKKIAEARVTEKHRQSYQSDVFSECERMCQVAMKEFHLHCVGEAGHVSIKLSASASASASAGD